MQRSIDFHLYRIKLIKPRQLSLIGLDLTSSMMLVESINEKPSIEFRENNVWHIGNVNFMEDGLASFAVGRTTKTTSEKFDKESGNFIEQIDDAAPFTQVMCDLNLGVIGISRKTKVAPDVASVARKIKSLVERTSVVVENGIEVRVDPIPDPEGFIKKIRAAYAVKLFRVAFTGPNPIDADEYFQKPISVYCQNMNGASGTIEVKGEALNQEFIEEVAVVTASTGNGAMARIQPSKGKGAVPVKLKGDAYKVVVDSGASRDEMAREVRAGYRRIRSHERDKD